MSNHKKNQTALEIIFLGFFRGLWWLITFPFRKHGKKKGLSESDKRYINSKSREIEQMTRSMNMYELRHAVIEADKLVDFVLKAKGYSGETFADRLRSAEKYIDRNQYQSIWDAHKIRNQIAHDDSKIDPELLKKSVKVLLSNIYL